MANVIQFTLRGVDEASKAFGAVARAAKTVAVGLAAVATAAAAAATAAFGFTNKMTKLQDELGKTARRLGLTANELDKLRFMADRSGVPVQQMTIGLQNLEKRASEAKDGLGEGAKAFAKLGISVSSFAELNPSEKMTVLADAMQGVRSHTDRVRIALDLFGRSGLGMLTVFEAGSEGVRQLGRDFEKFGGQVDKQGIANAERFQDAMTNFNLAMRRAGEAISNEMAPVFAGMVESIGEFVASMRSGISNFVSNVVLGFFTAFEIVKQVAERIAELWHRLFNQNLVDTLLQFAQWFGDLMPVLLNLMKAMLVAAAEVFYIAFKGIGDAIVEIIKFALGNVGALFGDILERVKTFGATFWETLKLGFQGGEGFGFVANAFKEAWNDAINIDTDDGPTFRDLFSNLADVAGGAADSLRKTVGGAFVDVQDAAGEAFEFFGDTLGINLDAATASAQALIERISLLGTVAKEETSVLGEELNTFVSGFTEKWQELTQGFMEQINTQGKTLAEGLFNTLTATADQLSSAIANTIVMGEDLAENVKKIAQQVIVSLIQMLIKLGIQRVIAAVLGIKADSAKGAAGTAAGLAEGHAHQFAQWSKTPAFAAAPALAAAATAAASAGAAGAASAGGAAIAALITKQSAGLAGVAHGGLTDVPREGTFLLDRGERVLSPQQNTDLTNFLDGQGGGGRGQVIIQNVEIHILENATNAEALLNMDQREVEELVSRRILPVLDTLDDLGIRQRAFERNGL